MTSSVASRCPRHAPSGYSKVIRTGQSDLFPVMNDELLTQLACGPEHLALLRTVGMGSVICVPLTARGRVLGALSLAISETSRVYGPADLALAENLGYRAAVAIYNARLYHDAQNAVRTRDQFLSIASHELKTPLTSLMGYVDLMQRRAARAGDFSRRDQRAMRVVGEQAARLNKLVGALLDLSRIETGQLSIERSLDRYQRPGAQAGRRNATNHRPPYD